MAEGRRGGGSRLRFEIATAGLVLVVAGVASAGGLLGRGGSSQEPRTTAAQTERQAVSVSAGTGAESTGSAATNRPPATAGRSPVSPPLPSLLAAIGDSYSQAYDVSPTVPAGHDNLANSWVLGTAVNDGVFSLQERFEALGASPAVVDAATSGTRMADALRQAKLVVAAAQQLPPGATAYVTFELGTNDLCADPQTNPHLFLAEIGAATAVLEEGLPPGSRILMLAVPDFDHFRAITQADATTRAFFASARHSRQCAPFLGARSQTPLTQASATLASYDRSLDTVCRDIEATYGPSDRLHCTGPTGLAESDFVVADLSSVDYFHPSLLGQASMADAAWKMGGWALVPLPADSIQ
jgi:lysophospholipase L1-like esterase